MRFSVRPFPGGYRAVIANADGCVVAMALQVRRNRNGCALDAQALIKAIRA